MGDFAWLDEQQDADVTFTPFFFLTFVCIAVLVILNVLIAIVCDAYAEAKDLHEKAGLPKVAFLTEVKELLVGVWQKPSRWNDGDWLRCEAGLSHNVSARKLGRGSSDRSVGDDDWSSRPLEGTAATLVEVVD